MREIKTLAPGSGFAAARHDAESVPGGTRKKQALRRFRKFPGARDGAERLGLLGLSGFALDCREAFRPGDERPDEHGMLAEEPHRWRPFINGRLSGESRL